MERLNAKVRDIGRRCLERLPTMAKTYRSVRALWSARLSTPHRTRWGFSLIGSRRMAEGHFETTETAIIEQLLSEADAFIDVGSNIGLYACIAASRSIATLAIEPQSENLPLLYENIVRNGLNVEVFPVALGGQPGITTLYGGGTGASVVRGWANSTSAYSERVACQTLDVLLRGRFPSQRLLIKIDVEGAELPLLQGGRETMERVPRPVWLVEICLNEHHPAGMNPQYLETFEYFFTRGYVACIANEELTEVRQADVREWLNGRRELAATHNFVFSDRDAVDLGSLRREIGSTSG